MATLEQTVEQGQQRLVGGVCVDSLPSCSEKGMPACIRIGGGECGCWILLGTSTSNTTDLWIREAGVKEAGGDRS